MLKCFSLTAGSILANGTKRMQCVRFLLLVSCMKQKKAHQRLILLESQLLACTAFEEALHPFEKGRRW